MNEKEFYDLLKQIEVNEYTEEKLSLTVSFFGEDPEALVIDDELVILLAKALKQNHYIKSLDLTGNHIGDKGAIALAGVSTLKGLGLWSNYVNNEGAIALAKSNLISLYLQENFIEKIKEDNELINAFIKNQSITDLNLYNNNISEKFVSQLITNNKTIRILNINDNQLTDNILINIKENTILEILNISRNNITDKGIEYICKNYSIKKLILNGTNITDEGIKLLSQHPTIKELSIGSCHNLTPEGLQCLIGSNLEEVHVSSDKITTQMIFYFQETFEYVKNQKFPFYLQQQLCSQTEIIDDSNMDDMDKDKTIELIGNSYGTKNHTN